MTEYRVGDIVTVLGWWNNMKPIECEIREVYKRNEDKQFVTVRPLTGNPHLRFINCTTIVNPRKV